MWTFDEFKKYSDIKTTKPCLWGILYLCGQVNVNEMDKETRKFVSVFPKTTKFLKIGLKWFFNDNIRKILSYLSSEFDSKSINTFYHLHDQEESCIEQMSFFLFLSTMKDSDVISKTFLINA